MPSKTSQMVSATRITIRLLVTFPGCKESNPTKPQRESMWGLNFPYAVIIQTRVKKQKSYNNRIKSGWTERNKQLKGFSSGLHDNIVQDFFKLCCLSLSFLMRRMLSVGQPVLKYCDPKLQMPVVWKLPNRRPPGHDIFVDRCTIYSYFTSNASRWAPGRMFSSIKYEHFVQVSSNQKYIYNVRWRTVWSRAHFKATMVYFACSIGGFACSHARLSPSAEIRSCDWFLVTLHFIGSRL